MQPRSSSWWWSWWWWWLSPGDPLMDRLERICFSTKRSTKSWSKFKGNSSWMLCGSILSRTDVISASERLKRILFFILSPNCDGCRPGCCCSDEVIMDFFCGAWDRKGGLRCRDGGSILCRSGGVRCLEGATTCDSDCRAVWIGRELDGIGCVDSLAVV